MAHTLRCRSLVGALVIFALAGCGGSQPGVETPEATDDAAPAGEASDATEDASENDTAEEPAGDPPAETTPED
jgi:hypothetical protein